MSNFKRMVFRARNYEQSWEIQQHLFSLGYFWESYSDRYPRKDIMFDSAEALFTNEQGQLSFMPSWENAKAYIAKEKFIQHYVEPTGWRIGVGSCNRGVIVVAGKRYMRADYEAMLATLEEQ